MKEKFLDSLNNILKDFSIDKKNKEILIKTLIKYTKKADKRRNGRKHKSPQQAIILEKEYIQNPIWNKRKIVQLSRDLKLSPYSVYKWNWDRNETRSKKYLDGKIQVEKPVKLFKLEKKKKRKYL